MDSRPTLRSETNERAARGDLACARQPRAVLYEVRAGTAGPMMAIRIRRAVGLATSLTWPLTSSWTGWVGRYHGLGTWRACLRKQLADEFLVVLFRCDFQGEKDGGPIPQ